MSSTQASARTPTRPREEDVLLELRDLRTYFQSDDGEVRAVDGVSFVIQRGRTLGLVGESGCGKSVTSLSIMRLIPDPPGRIASGEILFRDEDLVRASEERMRQIRGNDIAMIFQEPQTSLNPVFTVGSQIIEAIRLHQEVGKKEARARAIEMLRKVGIPAPERRIDEYPHQMSGGMKQRCMIAMALSCNPDLLIADEPSTALDVTIQAQILELMKSLQQEFEMSILLITHILGVVADMADDVAVMYASKIVEQADTATLFSRPVHPYTQGLFHSLPRLGTKQDRLRTIPGTVPNPLHFPSGCKFHDRCPEAEERCSREEPTLKPVGPDGHVAACLLREEHRP